MKIRFFLKLLATSIRIAILTARIERRDKKIIKLKLKLLKEKYDNEH